MTRETPCDWGECPYDAMYSEDCRYYCGLGVDADSYPDENEEVYHMSADRKEDIVNAAIEWAINVSEQVTRDLIRGMGITRNELIELGWEKDSLNFIDEVEVT